MAAAGRGGGRGSAGSACGWSTRGSAAPLGGSGGCCGVAGGSRLWSLLGGCKALCCSSSNGGGGGACRCFGRQPRAGVYVCFNHHEHSSMRPCRALPSPRPLRRGQRVVDLGACGLERLRAPRRAQNRHARRVQRRVNRNGRLGAGRDLADGGTALANWERRGCDCVSEEPPPCISPPPVPTH